MKYSLDSKIKYAFITDTHLGVRGGNQSIRNHQFDFYRNVFFPYLKSSGITTIIHLADFFDSRTAISHQVLRDTKEYISLLETNGIHQFQLVGNHDVPNKNNNNNDAITSLMESSDNITILDQFETVGDFFVCPWVNKENMQEFTDKLQASTAKYVIGHFDILGAKFSKYGNPSIHGLDSSMFRKFKRVFSGHFHTKSTIGNIEYLGSPFEYTWVDWNDPKGFHTFSPDKNELEFVPNPSNLFYKISLGDTPSCVPKKPTDGFTGKFVRVESPAGNKNIKKLPEMLGDVADLQIVLTQANDEVVVIDDIRFGSLSKMLDDGVQSSSVPDKYKSDVLKILNDAAV